MRRLSITLFLCGCRVSLPNESDPDADIPADADVAPADADVTQCSYTCSIDITGVSSNCSGPVSGTLDGAMYTASIALATFNELELTFTVCNPSGWTIHLADSPTCDGNSGDASSSSHDAELHIGPENDRLHLYTSDETPSGTSKSLIDAAAYVAATGCSTRTWIVRDQNFQSLAPALQQNSPYALRLDPPSDSQGVPDAIWYLGLNRVVGSTARTGSGATQATICLR